MQGRESERRLVGCRRSAVDYAERKRQERARGTDICRAIHPLVPKDLDAESVQSHGRTGGLMTILYTSLDAFRWSKVLTHPRYEEVAKRAKKKQKNRDEALS